MTTHDREAVIIAAKECYRQYSEWNIDIERFYAIAFDDGRKADKADAERYRWLCEQNEKGVGFFHLAFAARDIMNWKTKTEIDDGIDRARGDMK